MDLSADMGTARLLHRRRGLKRSRKLLATVLASLVTAAAAGSAWWFTSRPLEVEAVRAVRGPVAQVVYATGFVEPWRPVDVSSRVTAPVGSVLVDEGDRVARGQPLVVLDAADLRQSIAQLAAQRINAEQDERRALALFQRGFLSVAARDRATAAANQARAAEAVARERQDQFTVRSGIAGMVLRRDVEPGDLASPTKTMFEIGDPSSLRVTATVDERDIPLVRRGATVLMSSDAYPRTVFLGKVAEITPGGDPDQRAFRVRIRPDSSAKLPIGLTLEVNIVAYRKADALVVPAGSVRDGKLWVVEDGRVRQQRVEPGVHDAERLEVRAGLADGSCVISKATAEFEPGRRVSAKGC